MANLEKELTGSDDDDVDIVLAEYDSDTAVVMGSCDAEDRCVHMITWIYRS